MYVTRPLSMYRKSPSSLSIEPQEEGPYSGFLVITDEEAEAEDTFCWGACKLRAVKRLPFPQDKILSVVHSSDIEETVDTRVWFIPVLDQPLSSNRYYVVRAKGKYKGQACTSSRETDMGRCCFSNFINDVKPKPFDHRNIYQQFKIHRYHRHSFFTKSVATDGLPPKFLRKKGWELRTSSRRLLPTNYQLREALGLDNSLRTLLPSFNFPIADKRSASIVVGNWYCPLVFVKEEACKVRQQMNKKKMSAFYKMTLEQWWEEIGGWENVNVNDEDISVVNVNINVRREVDSVFGVEAVREAAGRVSHGGFVLFRVRERGRRRRRRSNRGGRSVGLSVAIVEKMKWVQEEGGWIDDVRMREKEVRVERTEEIIRRSDQEGTWKRFGCYVLVESFVLRRMNGSEVLRCDFRHTHRVQCKWE